MFGAMCDDKPHGVKGNEMGSGSPKALHVCLYFSSTWDADEVSIIKNDTLDGVGGWPCRGQDGGQGLGVFLLSVAQGPDTS